METVVLARPAVLVVNCPPGANLIAEQPASLAAWLALQLMLLVSPTPQNPDDGPSVPRAILILVTRRRGQPDAPNGGEFARLPDLLR
jgi:hypothetical protein